MLSAIAVFSVDAMPQLARFYADFGIFRVDMRAYAILRAK